MDKQAASFRNEVLSTTDPFRIIESAFSPNALAFYNTIPLKKVQIRIDRGTHVSSVYLLSKKNLFEISY